MIKRLLDRDGLLQLARFVVVGIVNTAFSYLIYAGLLYLGVNYAAANFIALVVGILFSYKTQATLVFGNPERGRLLRFIFAWALIYGLNVFVISRFNRLGFNAYVSGAFAIPFMTVLSFLAQKYFVFRPNRVTTTPSV